MEQQTQKNPVPPSLKRRPHPIEPAKIRQTQGKKYKPHLSFSYRYYRQIRGQNQENNGAACKKQANFTEACVAVSAPFVQVSGPKGLLRFVPKKTRETVCLCPRSTARINTLNIFLIFQYPTFSMIQHTFIIITSHFIFVK
jgi:hypothetical protein